MESFDYLPHFKEEMVPNLVTDAVDWALTHGLSVRRRDSSCKYSVTSAPFTLLPSKFPAEVFLNAVSLQPDMGTLYHRIAYDFEFVSGALLGVAAVDRFVQRLLDIYTTVVKEGVTQPLSLDIQRSDYMGSVNPETGRFAAKQVEVNNIAASFAGLSTVCSQMHRWLLRSLTHGQPGSLDENKLPKNESLDTVATALVEAWKMYGQQRAVILIVVEDVTLNIADQRLIEYAIIRLTEGKVRVLRLALSQCHRRLKLDDSRGRALVLVTADGQRCEIAVAYFRTGYVPEQYDGDDCWRARLTIERSRAIKCPWIGYQLAGTKKIQQLLATPAILRRFVADEDVAARIESSFVNMYGLDRDSAGTEAIIDTVLRNPDAFVMKPQLEGGGNNLFGDSIVQMLKSDDQRTLERFIVMDRIHPFVHRNVVVRYDHDSAALSRVVSELGIFGCMIGNDKDVLWQLNSGHLLRTKPYGIDEGGIMAGASALDSPYLFQTVDV